MSFIVKTWISLNPHIYQKNHTYVKKVGTPHNFYLAFTDELEKKLLKWVNKKWKNFNIYNVAFFNKNKEKHPEISLLCTKNLHDMINRYQDIQCDRLKLVIMGHFLPFHSTP